MKNALLLVIAVLLPFGVASQQITIDPANWGEHITLGSLTKLSDGSYVNVGTISNPQALVMQIDALGTGSAWSKVCGQYSTAFDVKQAPNGNIIVCGWAGDGNAFIESFDSQTGSTVWSKTFSTDSVEVLNGIDIDPLGGIYAVGSKRYSSTSDSREFYMKLDASGNVLWSVQANRGPSTESTAQYCYYKGDSLVVVGTSYLSGPSMSNGSVTVTFLDSGDGSLISSHMFGTHNQELLLDAKANEDGIFALCSTGNSSSLVLAKIGWSLSTASVLIYGDGPSFGFGVLALDETDVYVSGGVMEIGFPETSYVMKFDQLTLGREWSKKMDLDSRGTTGTGIGGGVMMAFKKADGTNTLSVVEENGQTICGPVSNLLNTEVWAYALNHQTVVLGLTSTNFAVGETVFVDYEPSVTACGNVLPVELISFTGEKDGETSVLSWQTASERNVSHFALQRSEDGFQWKEIGMVNATGNSQQLQSYEFVDDNPLLGDNYYRISSVDLDGTLEFSDIVVLSFNRSASLIVYPNPVTADEALNVKGEFQSVMAYGRDGQSIPLERNGNQLKLKAGPGVYLLTFLSADGASETVRVVIN